MGEDAESLLNFAVKLHGHLGPFLVLGVRAGLIARKLLDHLSKVEVYVFPSPPISCIIDGVQVSSGCTIGNGKLLVNPLSERSEVKMKFYSDRRFVTVQVSKEMISRLLSKMPMNDDELRREAEKLLHEKDDLLFTVTEER